MQYIYMYELFSETDLPLPPEAVTSQLLKADSVAQTAVVCEVDERMAEGLGGCKPFPENPRVMRQKTNITPINAYLGSLTRSLEMKSLRSAEMFAKLSESNDHSAFCTASNVLRAVSRWKGEMPLVLTELATIKYGGDDYRVLLTEGMR
jgi:hypothetical protein